MASDDDAAPVPAAVEHTEGTSYEVAFGDPVRYPLHNSENYSIRDFHAVGGENPYRVEYALLPPLVEQLAQLATPPENALAVRIGNAICVSVYDALRCVPEQSRGLSSAKLIVNITKSNLEVRTIFHWILHDAQLGDIDGARSFLCVCLIICLYRMCHRDGTLQAFTETPEKATTSAPTAGHLAALYFNLSARERTRLREHAKAVLRDRRMPSILARQLIIRKVDKKKLHGQLRRLVYGLFMTESDELFRVVVSFL